MLDAAGLARKFQVLARVLDERTRRLVAAAEAEAIGFGGVTAVARASSLCRGTVIRGLAEIRSAPKPARGQPIRRKGAGRKRTVDRDATLKRDLEALVEPVSRGDPESALRWTCKSVRQLAAELQRKGHHTSHRMVAELLHSMDYSLQANRKTLEGSSHPDRDAQFHHISDKIREFQAQRQPVISVDTKKKELVGDFKNNGRELRPKGDPETVRVHDFLIPELGRAAPYGVYDVTQNAGWVSVGMDHDTAAFAAQSIRRWWESMGSRGLSQSRQAAHHGRLRREQRRPRAALETGIAEAGRRDRTGDLDLPLAAGDQQVEQDRTPAVLLHQPELARQTFGQSSSDRQSHCGDHDQDRAAGPR